MAKGEQPTVLMQDARRDVAAARAELTGQRQQAVADFDERLRLLERLDDRLSKDPSVNLREVQHKVRRALQDRRSKVDRRSRPAVGVTTGTRGVGPEAKGPGKTTKVPHMRANLATESSNGSRSATRISSAKVKASASRALGHLDGHLAECLLRPTPTAADKVEVGLLVRYRRGLACHVQVPPEDPVLLESLSSFADEAESAFAALQGDATTRATEFLRYARLLIAQLAALGGKAGGLKSDYQKLKAELGGPSPAEVERGSAALVLRIQSEMGRKAANRGGSMLDGLLG